MAKTFVSGEVLTASDVNVNLATYMPMIPSSVAGSGVSYSTTTGLVHLSAASSASLNGVFTSTYSRYEVVFDFPTTSANLTFTARMRLSGTDNTSSVYDIQSLVARGADANGVATNQFARTSWPISSTTDTRLHFGKITLVRPATASPTMISTESFSTLNPATAANTTAIAFRGGLHRDSTAFDGISIIFSGGTATGTMKVFGFN